MMLMNDVEVVEFLERKYIEIHEKAKVCGKVIPNFSANAKYERNLEIFKEFIYNPECDIVSGVGGMVWFNIKQCKEVGQKYNLKYRSVIHAMSSVINKFRLIAEKYQIEFKI